MKKTAGFTLLEMVVVIAIIGVLASAVSPIAIESIQAYDVASSVAVTLDKLRYASERMAYEIREMNSGSITTMTSTSLSLSRTDYYGLGLSSTTVNVAIAQSSDKNNVTLTYSSPISGSYTPGYTPVLTDQLYKGTVSAPANGLSFTYYDSSYAVTTTSANVRYIGIDLTLAATVSGSPQTYAQHTLVALRNQ